jgi:hypothetical protein
VKDQEHRMSDETTPQDSAAMPPASAGSAANPLEQVIRGTVRLHELIEQGRCDSEEADAVRDEMDAPFLELSESEREAVRLVSEAIKDWDTDERSCASRGSHDEPIGHQHVDEYGRPSGFLSWRDGETRWPKSQMVPVYLRPQPTLTDAERAAVERSERWARLEGYDSDAATLRGLVARLLLPPTPTDGK